jgi:hypothetical protein
LKGTAEVHGQAHGGDAPAEGAVDDLEFHSGQWLAEAPVHPEAEGDVPAGIAVEV